MAFIKLGPGLVFHTDFRLEGFEGRGESDEDLAQQKAEPADQAAEVVAGGGENGVGSVAPTVREIVAAHAVLGFEMADHGSTADLRRSSRLILGVTPRFWPEMKTLNL